MTEDARRLAKIGGWPANYSQTILCPTFGGATMDGLSWFFTFCAIVGGTILIIQFVMTLVGLGGDHGLDGGHGDFHTDAGPDAQFDSAHGADGEGHDSGGHHGSSWLFAMISFRTLVAAAAFFGLAGLAANSAQQSTPVQLLLAGVAGFAAMYGVHWMVRAMGRLGEDGTIRVKHALGKEATVYIPIPAAKSQAGKVQLKIQDRLVEYEAITAGPSSLATGTKVRVVGITGNTLEVEPLPVGSAA
ncbi:MAG: NfeD family protein [Pirellulaceae bacterium]|nr:NfeD family protein [Pirellulaceae bacterium]